MVTLESVALAHAAAGLPVLPLLRNEKLPAARRGVHSASMDPDRIRAWYLDVPTLNVGVRTGAGIVGIDLDVKGTSGYVELASAAYWLGIRDDSWLDTFTVTTPSGGIHLYYRTDHEIGNRVAVLPGVDVRGESGYLVAGYSRLGSKVYLPESGYTETVTVNPDGTEVLTRFAPELAPLPEWLHELVTRREEPRSPEPRSDDEDLGFSDPPGYPHLGTYVGAVLQGERHRILSAEPGTRNNALNYASYRLGRHVAAGRLDYDEAEAWLRSAAHHQRSDPTGERPDASEAQNLATIRSGLRGGMRDA